MSAAQLELAASILGPLVDEVVFVGGATIHLWLTDPAAPPARATDDVDVICEVQTRGEYYAFAERLRERGLEERMGEPVVCRWRDRGSGLVIDVMPTKEHVLGFSNPWYRLALDTALEQRLASGATIRAAPPPVIVATKIAAWQGRGQGDVMRSHDVHDVLVLVNGRPELVAELREQPADLQRYVAAELALLRDDPYFSYAVQDAVRGYGSAATERAAIVEERLAEIVAP